MVYLSPEYLADMSLSAFETVVGSTPGFRPRPGQHEMAACVAATLSRADLGEQLAHIRFPLLEGRVGSRQNFGLFLSPGGNPITNKKGKALLTQMSLFQHRRKVDKIGVAETSRSDVRRAGRVLRVLQ